MIQEINLASVYQVKTNFSYCQYVGDICRKDTKSLHIRKMYLTQFYHITVESSKHTLISFTSAWV